MSTETTYSQSYEAAKGHARNFLQSTIGNNPGTTAVIMAVLVVLILVLLYQVYAHKKKSRFHIAPISNLTTGNNNPLWWHGSMDAGNWGPVHREATAWNVAAYHPGWRAGASHRAGYHEGLGRHEGLAPHAEGFVGPGPCNPGETAVTYQDPDGGAMVTYCRSTDALPGPPTVCGRGWDPAATAEAQALATVGSLQHDAYGERKLQRAVEGAYDSNIGLSDDQLTTLMHQGGTP